MPLTPRIRIRRSDIERLESMLERPELRGQPASLALEDELERAEVVEDAALPDDVIAMNRSARFVDEADGSPHALTLVYPWEADVDHGKVSILAPVGSALIGLAVGQSIDWPLPGGRVARLKVLSVSDQP